jgi:hypothetical protein
VRSERGINNNNNKSSKNVSVFKYLGTAASHQNLIHEERGAGHGQGLLLPFRSEPLVFRLVSKKLNIKIQKL